MALLDYSSFELVEDELETTYQTLSKQGKTTVWVHSADEDGNGHGVVVLHRPSGIRAASTEFELSREENEAKARETLQKKLYMASLSQEDVDDVLALLALRFGERVAPVSNYCQAFYDWEAALRDKLAELDDEIASAEAAGGDDADNLDKPTGLSVWSLRHEREQWQEIVDALGRLFIPIMKSNYLARRIYMGEPHRTVKCPEHQGRWSGYAGPGEECPYGCSLGAYDITGWLPAEDTAADSDDN